MSNILIADLKQGTNKLTALLSSKYQLDYAETMSEIVQIANRKPLDLLIIGLLFDDSRMYDTVRMARNAPSLSTIPVIGFSDEHTSMSISGRDAIENIMHLVGACDYIDTRGMDDDEILNRIETALKEKKSVARKVQQAESTPKAKREQQEQIRLSPENVALFRKTPYKILLIGSDDALFTTLKKEIDELAGISFDIERESTLSAGLAQVGKEKFDALVCDFDSLQAGNSYEAIHLFAPDIPLIGFTGKATRESLEGYRSCLFELLPREDVTGNRVSLAILSAIVRHDKPDTTDSGVATFLIGQLTAALKKVEKHAPLREILSSFCLALEDYGRLELHDDFCSSVLLFDSVKETLQTLAAPSLPEAYCNQINGMQVSDNAGSCGTAAYLGEPVYVSNIDVDIRWKDFRAIANEYGLKSCWSIPIFSKEGTITGTFAIYHNIPRLPTSTELRLVGGASTLVTTIFAESMQPATSQPG